MHPYRSILFLPGHKPDWVPKALKSGADAIVLDLEDAVPAGEKEAARVTVADSIAHARSLDPDERTRAIDSATVCRAAAFSSNGTESSRSSTTASAPLATALSTHVGR